MGGRCLTNRPRPPGRLVPSTVPPVLGVGGFRLRAPSMAAGTAGREGASGGRSFVGACDRRLSGSTPRGVRALMRPPRKPTRCDRRLSSSAACCSCCSCCLRSSSRTCACKLALAASSSAYETAGRMRSASLARVALHGVRGDAVQPRAAGDGASLMRMGQARPGERGGLSTGMPNLARVGDASEVQGASGGAGSEANG